MALRRVITREKIPAEKRLDEINQQISGANIVLDESKKNFVVFHESIEKAKVELEKYEKLYLKEKNLFDDILKARVLAENEYNTIFSKLQERKTEIKNLDSQIQTLIFKLRDEEQKIFAQRRSAEEVEKQFLIDHDNEVNRYEYTILLKKKDVERYNNSISNLDVKLNNNLDALDLSQKTIIYNGEKIKKINETLGIAILEVDKKKLELNTLLRDIDIFEKRLVECKRNLEQLSIEKQSMQKAIDNMKEQQIYLVKKEERLNEFAVRLKELYKKSGVDVTI